MPDFERIIPAFCIQTGVPATDIDELFRTVKRKFPNPRIPRLQIEEEGLEVDIVQVTPSSGLFFTAVDGNTGAIAYTHDMTDFVQRGELLIPSEELPVEPLLVARLPLSTSSVNAIRREIRKQAPSGTRLPNLTVRKGDRVTAGIRQTSPEGGIFIFINNNRRNSGIVTLTDPATPLVERVLRRRIRR